MKKFYYLPLALAALGFTACSSDDAVTADEGTAAKALAEGGYMKVAVNLPSTTATKADDAGVTFDDGLDAEYAVKDVTLLLFQGSDNNDEADRTFVGAYTYSGNGVLYSDSPNQITSVVKIDPTTAVKGSSKIYALVVLNKHDVVTVTDKAGCTVNGTTLEKTSKFSDVAKAIVSAGTTSPAVDVFAGDISTKGILMVNAPLAAAKGSATATTYTTLAEVNADNIYKTEEEAKANPAAEIFVERAVAKVTMEKETKAFTLANDANISVTSLAWGLDLTNKQSYFVHQLDGEKGATASWDTYQSGALGYRFIGTNRVKDGYGYRSYWGLDPNYNSEDNRETYGYETKTTNDITTATWGNNNPLYCLENTFDVANQNQDQTTRVIVKMQLTPKYVADNNADGYSTYTASDNFYYRPNAGESKTIAEKDVTLHAYTKAGLEAIATTYAKQLDSKIGDNAVTIDWNTDDPNKVVVASMTYGTSSTAVGDDVIAGVNASLGEVALYTGGVCYYPIRIKHFGDTQTPWFSSDTGVSTSSIYGFANGSTDETSGYGNATIKATADKSYLGRYGVLRNNWYNISIKSISKPGSADTPDKGNTPDDELTNYISFSINILSWAKRTQDVNL